MFKAIKTLSAVLSLLLFGTSNIKAQEINFDGGNSAPVAAPQAAPAVSPPMAAAAQQPYYDFWGRSFQGSSDPRVGTGGLLPMRSSSIALLNTGAESLAARLATLQNAKRSIRIQALIFSADETGMAVARILKEKHRQGLDVRVIVDAFSNIINSKKQLDLATQFMYYDLKQNGIEVEGYEALFLQWMNELSMHDPKQPDKRFHDKMWIIDAEDPASASAGVGGRHKANENFQLGKDAGHRWRDQDFLVAGEVVADVTAVFERNYAEQKRIKNSRPGILNTDTTWALWRKYIVKTFGTYTPKFELDGELQGRVDAVLNGARSFTPELYPVKMRFLQSRPREKETYILQAYEDLCAAARKELLIVNAYFVPTPRVLEAIKGAARRGAAVTIITNSPATNDLPEMAYASRYSYRELLAVNDEAGARGNGGSIRIAEWNGQKFGEGTLHAKFAVADRKYVIGGSYNLDPRSELLNSETIIEFENEKLAASLADSVTAGDLPKCELMTKEQAAVFHDPQNPPDIFKLLLWNGLRGEL
ncbi:MAG: phosphatidylserine/phosphatidylglycerophosphate/cardiolipin synthase family protein [Elusimicrobia bacterium]|nr:phosphatidylserine/phosphatidylglycerophosphate/cardiolipin synthase family protein [Elusimicrobiota bacterium]